MKLYDDTQQLSFDLYPVHVAKLSDLSQVIFESEYLPAAFAADVPDENRRTLEERLASCKVNLFIGAS